MNPALEVVLAPVVEADTVVVVNPLVLCDPLLLLAAAITGMPWAEVVVEALDDFEELLPLEEDVVWEDEEEVEVLVPVDEDELELVFEVDVTADDVVELLLDEDEELVDVFEVDGAAAATEVFEVEEDDEPFELEDEVEVFELVDEEDVLELVDEDDLLVELELDVFELDEYEDDDGVLLVDRDVLLELVGGMVGRAALLLTLTVEVDEEDEDDDAFGCPIASHLPQTTLNSATACCTDI